MASHHNRGDSSMSHEHSSIRDSPSASTAVLHVTQHVTSTGKIVQLREIQYSEGVRCYRVERCCRDCSLDITGNFPGGFGLESGEEATAAAAAAVAAPAADMAGPSGAASTTTSTSSSLSAPFYSSMPGDDAIRSASLYTFCRRLLTMNDLFLLVVMGIVVMPPLMGWGGVRVQASAVAGGGDALASTGSNAVEMASTIITPTAVSSLGAGRIAGLLCLLLPFLLWTCVRAGRALMGTYIEEVVAMEGLGLQFNSYNIFNQVKSTYFVDLTLIRTIIIHDAFFRLQPIFFLSASVESAPRRAVFFASTLPRLEVLLPVLRGVRSVLYGEAELGKSMAELEEEAATAVSSTSRVDPKGSSSSHPKMSRPLQHAKSASDFY